MTSETDGMTGEDNDRDQTLDPTAAPDDVLAVLVRTVNSDPKASFGVTLLVHGVAISGDLVGGEAFFGEQADELEEAQRESGVEPSPDSIPTYFGECAASYTADVETMPLAYAHLKGAKIYQGGFGAAIEVGWWRGRLSSIDGWTLGKLRRNDATSSLEDPAPG